MLEVIAKKRRGSFELDVNFQLPTPGVVALFGRSGSGKSTVVDIIAGLLSADSGRIALDDVVLADTRQRIRVSPERRRIGYVFQDARLFPHLSVAGNLAYAERRAQSTAYVDLEAVTRLLDLAPLMGRRTHTLSGGEKQRVAIGRALLSQPRLLLLDEPLAALDDARRGEVLPYLETLRDALKIPMVYVTHNFDEVQRLATHVVLMGLGSVLAQGPVDAMSLDPQLRSIVGRDEVGAIIDGIVLGADPAGGGTRIRIGGGEITALASDHLPGTALRVQFLARDIIITTQLPEHISVRNKLAGVVTHIQDDGDSDLVFLDIGAASVLARITKSATQELALRPGMPAWALIKSAALRGHSHRAPTRPASPGA
jgi:molybdate transport system ATP-binding protein